MSYIIVTRNPSNKHLIAVVVGDESDKLAEYKTASEAMETADNMAICQAWGYEIIEVNQP